MQEYGNLFDNNIDDSMENLHKSNKQICNRFPVMIVEDQKIDYFELLVT